MQDDEMIDNTEKESSKPIEKESAYIEMMSLQIGEESMLIPVPEIEEIVRVQALTRVPMAPNHLLGVCNVHGQVVCVIDPCMVMRLNVQSPEDTPSTRFVILRHSGMNLALKVAAVPALYRVKEHLVPNLKHGAKGFFRGEMEVNHKVYRVLHTHALFA